MNPPSVPEYERRPNGHVFRWIPELIAMRIDRLYEDSRHNLFGELTVKAERPDLAYEDLHQSRLNITSSRARKTVATALDERFGLLNWETMVEQACILVLRSQREGQPAYDLSEGEVRESVEYLIKPLLVKGEANVIYGDGGTGKSYLALYLGLLTSLPMNSCGWEVEPAIPFYLDWETNLETAMRRLAWLANGVDCPRSHVLYRRCYRSLIDDIEEIQNTVAEKDVGLVIIDSAAGACGAEPESAAQTSGVFQALRGLGGITTLIVTHVAKNASVTSPFGSAYWRNLARNAYEVRHQQESDRNVNTIGVFHRKSNDDKLLSPFALRFQYQDKKVTVERTDISKMPDLLEAMSARQQIGMVLRQGPMSVDGITAQTGLPENTVRGILNRYKREFVNIQKGGNIGKWALGHEEDY